jgi:hypothetical protein
MYWATGEPFELVGCHSTTSPRPNGPREVVNGRLETFRGITLGSRNLQDYITGSLLRTGVFRQVIHAKT